MQIQVKNSWKAMLVHWLEEGKNPDDLKQQEILRKNVSTYVIT